VTDWTEIADPPTSLVIESVSACNLRCPHCAVGVGIASRAGRLHAMCREECKLP